MIASHFPNTSWARTSLSVGTFHHILSDQLSIAFDTGHHKSSTPSGESAATDNARVLTKMTIKTHILPVSLTFDNHN